MNSTTSQYDGNIKIKDALSKYLKTDTPVSIGKMGNSEFIGLLHHVRGLQLSDSARQLVTVNAGVYPDTDKVLSDFFELYQSSLGTLDIAAKWISGDEDFLRSINANIEMVELRSIEPYYHNDPWSSVLEGQSVVVVSPFSSTVESQYNKRKMLWEDKRVLPDFDLHTVQSPYISLGQGEETNWFAALEGMVSKVLKKKPKIVLVGAGAYSLPLLMKLKQKGISGVHLGGSNQILFGIKGRRWDSHDVIGKFYNEHWVRPDGSEVPKDNHLIEEGCYW